MRIAEVLPFLVGLSVSACPAPSWYLAQAPKHGHLWQGRAIAPTAGEASKQALAQALMRVGLEHLDSIGSILEMRTSTSSTKRAKSQLVSEVKVKGHWGESEDPIIVLREETASCTSNESFVLLCRPGEGIACRLEASSRLVPVFQSAILPGLGQILNGRKWQGMAWMGSVAASLAGALIAHNLSQESRGLAHDAKSRDRREFFQERARNYDRTAGILLSVAIVANLGNLGDAFNQEPAWQVR